MATLVLTAVGTALGGPIGGALGSLVGQSIDLQLFGPGMRKGPRLGDLSVQTSSYGSPIPRIYGTMRVAGTVVWATDLQEEETVEGGGKGSPERVTYLYSANLAVALSSRPIRSVKRIWADGKLIRGASGDFKVRTKFRLHKGQEDQGSDPLIASVETIAQCPAYRGLALAVFEKLELAEFGNRIPVLTFEVEADDGEVALSALLADAGGGLIDSDDDRPIPGYAAHGSSIGDSLRDLIELTGVELAEGEGRLRGSAMTSPILLDDDELGCDADDETRPRAERIRTPDSSLPASLSMTHYDPARDYQAGQMRASSGQGGVRDERVELPAVLTAAQARLLAEQGLARRWRSGDRLRARLAPRRMGLRPGDPIQLPGASRAWTVRSVTIDGMAVTVEAEAAAVTIAPLPADPGRPISEPDLLVGRSEIMLFELPPPGDAPAATASVYLAGSNAGRWKPLPVELALGADAPSFVSLERRAVAGKAESVLAQRSPMVLDELSSVVVRLANPIHVLLNCDHDALMAGTNLAVLGSELIQFGRAEQLAAGLYRLSSLLRGRRGTEWAASDHSAGEPFCLVDPSAMRLIELPASAVGATLVGTAHGVGDNAPLPTTPRVVAGETMRPPSPCHLRLWRAGSEVEAEWVRRSHRGWAWSDGVGVAEDPFPERYRLIVDGPGGQQQAEVTQAMASLAVSSLPAGPGQAIQLSVATIGPMAVSHPAAAILML